MAEIYVEDMKVGLTVSDENALTPAQEQRIAALIRRELEAIERNRMVAERNTRLSRSASQRSNRFA